MEQRLKERLTGAVVLLLLVVIALPLILDDTRDTERRIKTTNIPEQPQEQFSTRLVPIPEPDAAQPDAGPAQEAAGAETPAGEAAGLTGWVVQVGSFSRKNADKLNDKLRAAGYRAYVVDEPVAASDGAMLYRVRVGPAALRSEALKLKTELKQDQGLDGFVLNYP